MKRVISTLFTSSIIVLLLSCGHKGALYLPGHPPHKHKSPLALPGQPKQGKTSS